VSEWWGVRSLTLTLTLAATSKPFTENEEWHGDCFCEYPGEVYVPENGEMRHGPGRVEKRNARSGDICQNRAELTGAVVERCQTLTRQR
jgi:hypothetical protein